MENIQKDKFRPLSKYEKKVQEFWITFNLKAFGSKVSVFMYVEMLNQLTDPCEFLSLIATYCNKNEI